jgi:hypothetical protein
MTVKDLKAWLATQPDEAKILVAMPISISSPPGSQLASSYLDLQGTAMCLPNKLNWFERFELKTLLQADYVPVTETAKKSTS